MQEQLCIGSLYGELYIWIKVPVEQTVSINVACMGYLIFMTVLVALALPILMFFREDPKRAEKVTTFAPFIVVALLAANMFESLVGKTRLPNKKEIIESMLLWVGLAFLYRAIGKKLPVHIRQTFLKVAVAGFVFHATMALILAFKR